MGPHLVHAAGVSGQFELMQFELMQFEQFEVKRAVRHSQFVKPGVLHALFEVKPRAQHAV